MALSEDRSEKIRNYLKQHKVACLDTLYEAQTVGQLELYDQSILTLGYVW